MNSDEFFGDAGLDETGEDGGQDATEAEPVPSSLLNLKEIETLTGISYATLSRYIRDRANLDRIPHEGEGRARRFYPEAIAVFKTIKQEGIANRGSRGPKVASNGRRRKKMAAPVLAPPSAATSSPRPNNRRRPSPPARHILKEQVTSSATGSDSVQDAFRRAAILSKIEVLQKIKDVVDTELDHLNGDLG